MPVEVWLRGPVEGVDPQLMPAAHALLQVREEIESTLSGFAPTLLWVRPGAASVGFHLRHLAGSTRRLLAYARGESLSDEQIAQARAEGSPDEASVESLVADAHAAIDEVLTHIRAIDPSTLLATRGVGRARLPSTVGGLLFHIAEHAQRHAGQLVTTAKVVSGLESRVT